MTRLLLALVASAGCMAPPGRAVQLRTEPPGAAFDTSWGETGVTPCEIRVPVAEEGGEIQLRHADCEDRELRIEPGRGRPVTTFALITFGLLIDPFSEEDGPETLVLRPDQNELHVVLEPAAAGPR